MIIAIIGVAVFGGFFDVLILWWLLRRGLGMLWDGFGMLWDWVKVGDEMEAGNHCGL